MSARHIGIRRNLSKLCGGCRECRSYRFWRNKTVAIDISKCFGRWLLSVFFSPISFLKKVYCVLEQFIQIVVVNIRIAIFPDQPIGRDGFYKIADHRDQYFIELGGSFLKLDNQYLIDKQATKSIGIELFLRR